MKASKSNLLDEIQARADAATEGPWEAQEFDDSPGDEGSCILAGAGMEARAIAYSIPYPWHPEKETVTDAVFIAHAREDVPKLVAALHAVLDLHSPVAPTPSQPWETCNGCTNGDNYPCPTIRAITEGLG